MIMRSTLASLALAASLATGTAMADQQTQLKACTSRWSSMTTIQRGIVKRDEFVAQGLKSSPAAAAAKTAKAGAGGDMPKLPGSPGK
jgi:hypothetical protein